MAAPMCSCGDRGRATSKRRGSSITDPLLQGNHTCAEHYTTEFRGTHLQNEDMSEAEIKDKLRWHFLNPYEKYKRRGRKPWKLVLQIAKIVLVTFQVWWFAIDQFSVVNFNKDNTQVFRSLFLKSYSQSEITEIYTRDDLYDHIYHVWTQYYDFTTIAIGTYTFPRVNGERKRIKFCLAKEHHGVSLNKTMPNDVYEVNNDKSSYCRDLLPPGKTRSIGQFIADNDLPNDFHWVLSVKMHFEVNTINLKELKFYDIPDCYNYSIVAHFDNTDEDAVMQAHLDASSIFHPCKNGMVDGDPGNRTLKTLLLIFDICVINVCIWSALLCIRSALNHWKLCQDVTKFFKDYRHENFTFSDKLNFINFWIILIVISDTFTVCGSVMKIIINQYYATFYDLCGMFLGSAVLLVWVGVLRYLGYLRYYNALLVTLKVAFPTVIRFIVCVMLIYFGFAFCGWIVFGPYHYKFRSLSVTSECLFSLVNGDDMFQTFKSLKNAHLAVWIFLQFYLYSFISLFIFVVLSLFIGIISDTYERIKDYGHPPKTRIELFMDDLEYQGIKSPDDGDSNGSDNDQANHLCPHRWSREERHNSRAINFTGNNSTDSPSADMINFTLDSL